MAEISTEMTKIGDIDYQELKEQDTLLHIAISDADHLNKYTIVKGLLEAGANPRLANCSGHYPIHTAISFDLPLIVELFIAQDPTFLDLIDDNTGFNLVHFAAYFYATESLKFLHKKDSNLINEFVSCKDSKHDGVSPAYIALTGLTWSVDNTQSMKVTKNRPIEEDNRFQEAVDFLLAVMSPRALIIPKFGCVLHHLIRIDYIKGIEDLLKRFKDDPEVIRSLISSKHGPNGPSPLFTALSRSTSDYQAASILLRYGADAKEVWIKRKGVELTTTEAVLSQASNMEQTVGIVDKLLENGADLQATTEAILDVSSLSFDLLKVAIKHAKSQGKEVSDIINHIDKTTKNTVLHTLLESNQTNDITSNLGYLLDNGVCIMLHAEKSIGNEEYLLPVHVATSVQSATDQSPSESTVTSYGKKRLTQYIQCLKKHGIENILKGKLMKYRVDFVKYHLTPSVYCVDHEFVHLLLTEFYRLPDNSQKEILHYRRRNPVCSEALHPKALRSRVLRSESPRLPRSESLCSSLFKEDEGLHVYEKYVLYWATHLRQPSIMNDIVKAEYNVHKVFEK